MARQRPGATASAQIVRRATHRRRTTVTVQPQHPPERRGKPAGSSSPPDSLASVTSPSGPRPPVAGDRHPGTGREPAHELNGAGYPASQRAAPGTATAEASYNPVAAAARRPITAQCVTVGRRRASAGPTSRRSIITPPDDAPRTGRAIHGGNGLLHLLLNRSLCSAIQVAPSTRQRFAASGPRSALPPD